MTQQTAPRDRTHRRRPRSWLPALVLVPLGALLAPGNASTPVHPPPHLAATDAADLRAQWTPRPPLNVARAGHDVATVHRRIFAIGGFGPDLPNAVVLNSVEARRIGGRGTWHTVAPMPTARSNPAAAALDGIVYVAGGFGPVFILDVVETFDPATGTWTTSPKLPVPRGAAGAAALGGQLYVAGGLIPGSPDDKTTASVVVYNPRKGTWNAVQSMTTARKFVRLVATAGYLYAIGGLSQTDDPLPTVERYDPKSNTWTTVAAMNQVRGNPGVVAINHGSKHLIVVVGGRGAGSGPQPLRSTEVYNPDTNRWQLLQAQLPRGRGTLVAAAEPNGTILAIGGAVNINGTETATAEVHALKL